MSADNRIHEDLRELKRTLEKTIKVLEQIAKSLTPEPLPPEPEIIPDEAEVIFEKLRRTGEPQTLGSIALVHRLDALVSGWGFRLEVDVQRSQPTTWKVRLR